MSEGRSSRLPGFFRLSPAERLAAVARFAGLDPAALAALASPDGLPQSVASNMSENVVGRFGFPLSFATNFRVNGVDYVVPMAIEEPSVVAASSFAARLLRGGEGIVAESTAPVMTGQIQFPEAPAEGVLEAALERGTEELRRTLDANHPRLVAAGGGFRGAEVRRLPGPDGRVMAVVHIYVDVRDAMGANAVNSMAEAAAPLLERWSGARVGLRILSNLPLRRRVKVTGRVKLGATRGTSQMREDEARRIVEASLFAEADTFRAVTANKGIMNGIDATLLATGQDFRAVEAGAHAFAARGGRYTALSQYRIEDGHLVGRMELPLSLGTVGGVTKVHPAVRANFRILGVEDAQRFGEVVAAVGLAQNLAATRALASEGIQRGHMSLHARNVAMRIGATSEEVPQVVAEMLAQSRTDEGIAREVLERLRG